MLNLFKEKKKFYIIGHSFGGLIAITLSNLLEKNGLTGEVIIVDGSVSLFTRFMKALMPDINSSHENIEAFLQIQLAYEILPDVDPTEIQKIMLEEKTFEGRIVKYISQMKNREYSTDYLKNIGYGIRNRVLMVLNENEEDSGDKINSNITLIRPTTKLVIDIDNDYKLKQYTNGLVFVNTIEGTHLTMLDNVKLYQIINDICTNKKQS